MILVGALVITSCRPQITVDDHQKGLDVIKVVRRDWNSIVGDGLTLVELKGAGLKDLVVLEIVVVKDDGSKIFDKNSVATKIKNYTRRALGESIEDVELKIIWK